MILVIVCSRSAFCGSTAKAGQEKNVPGLCARTVGSELFIVQARHLEGQGGS